MINYYPRLLCIHRRLQGKKKQIKLWDQDLHTHIECLIINILSKINFSWLHFMGLLNNSIIFRDCFFFRKNSINIIEMFF